MTRSTLISSCLALALALATVPATASAQSAAPAAAGAPAGLSAADVAPFLGDWTITGESQMGPFVVSLSIKTEEGKVVGTISSEVQAPTAITDIRKPDASLMLHYSFDYEGNAVPVVLTLTPKAEQLDANFTFADGAFEMGGLGSKAEAK